jgi:hypothetical protein
VRGDERKSDHEQERCLDPECTDDEEDHGDNGEHGDVVPSWARCYSDHMTALGTAVVDAGRRFNARRRVVNMRAWRALACNAGGLGLLSYAAYGWNHLVGYAAAGVSLFVLNALADGGRR